MGLCSRTRWSPRGSSRVGESRPCRCHPTGRARSRSRTRGPGSERSLGPASRATARRGARHPSVRAAWSPSPCPLLVVCWYPVVAVVAVQISQFLHGQPPVPLALIRALPRQPPHPQPIQAGVLKQAVQLGPEQALPHSEKEPGREPPRGTGSPAHDPPPGVGGHTKAPPPCPQP